MIYAQVAAGMEFATQARSASEGRAARPRWRFGFVLSSGQGEVARAGVQTGSKSLLAGADIVLHCRDCVSRSRGSAGAAVLARSATEIYRQRPPQARRESPHL